MKKNRLFFSLIGTIFIFIAIVIIYGIGNDFNGSVLLSKELCLISMGTIIYIIVLLLFSKVKWNSVTFLYIVFFYIFTFGQVVCRYVLGFIDSELFDLVKYINNYYVQRAMLIGIYSLLALNGFTILYCLKAKNKEKIYTKDDVKEKKDLKTIKKVAIILLIISAPIAIVDLISNLQLALSGGYKAVYSDVSYGLDSFASKIAPFFYTSLMLLTYANKNNKKVAFRCLLGILVYSSVSIFLGARGKPILQILSAIVLWNYIYPISKKKIILALLLVIPVSGLISMVRVFRQYALSEWISNIFNLFMEAMKNQPILKAVNEMGTAIFPIASTLEVVPNVINFKYGTTFLYAIGTILPNIFGNGAHWARLGANINMEIAEYLGAAFGGSIIQEMYANFNWWGGILAIGIFIYLFSMIENKCTLNPKELIMIPLFYSFLPSILWTVRNNSAPLIREFVWYGVTVYILYIIIKKRSKNESKRNNTSV